jgi:cyclophilin family peptidyl-prolyl cis-trans isomerase
MLKQYGPGHPLVKWLFPILAALCMAASMVASAAEAAALPDLGPYQPGGWSAPVVLSNVAGSSTNAASFVEGCHYVDWAVANDSAVDIGQTFTVRLLTDGAIVGEWSAKGLAAYSYINLKDIPLYLTEGNHIVTLVIDGSGVVNEQDESNNAYSSNISAAPGPAGAISTRLSSLDFGKAFSGDTTVRTISFFNQGPGGQGIGNVSIAGADGGAFTISADSCTGKALPPPNCLGACAASCTVTVAFSPEKTEQAAATLTLYDASHGILTQVPLNGAGEPGTGDFNGDGRISLEDVVLLLKVMSGVAVGDGSVRVQAGIDSVNGIGCADAIFMLQLVAGQRASDLQEFVRIQTRFGSMLIQLYDDTPLHRDNFLALAKAGFYDGLVFHRVINDFMIQGGDPLGTGTGGPGYTICPEIRPTLTHDFGAVAAARLADSVNPEKSSSGSQFYIVENTEGAHFLDANYTVFGKVIEGLSVIHDIAEQPTDENDRPLTGIVMEKVEVGIGNRR